MNRLRATIERAFTDLSAHANPWAVVGGLAVSTYAEPRTTRDLDVVVAVSGDSEAEQLVWSLLQQGYSVVAAVEHTARGRLATMRLQPPMKGAAIVDLLFASSGIEAEIAAAAVHLEILPGLSAPVAAIGHLIAMKVLARDDRRRPQDWGRPASAHPCGEPSRLGPSPSGAGVDHRSGLRTRSRTGRRLRRPARRVRSYVIVACGTKR